MPSTRSILAACVGVLTVGATVGGSALGWTSAADAHEQAVHASASTPTVPVVTPPPETWTVAPPTPRTSTSTAPGRAPAAPTPSATAVTSPRTTVPAPPTRATAPARPAGKVVYLTFDDGPHPAYTPRVLRILDQYGAKATFFQIGEEAARFPALVRRVRAEGHAIGNHSYTHPWLSDLPEDGVRSELQRTDDALGARTTCLRPPGGMDGGPVKKVASSLGMSLVGWTVDTTDWRRPGAPTILENALIPPDGSKGNDRIVLMHDGGGDRIQTLAALPFVIQKLADQGYTFDTLPACRG